MDRNRNNQKICRIMQNWHILQVIYRPGKDYRVFHIRNTNGRNWRATLLYKFVPGFPIMWSGGDGIDNWNRLIITLVTRMSFRITNQNIIGNMPNLEKGFKMQVAYTKRGERIICQQTTIAPLVSPKENLFVFDKCNSILHLFNEDGEANLRSVYNNVVEIILGIALNPNRNVCTEMDFQETGFQELGSNYLKRRIVRLMQNERQKRAEYGPMANILLGLRTVRIHITDQ